MAGWLDTITGGLNSFNNAISPTLNSLGSLYRTLGGGSSSGFLPTLGSIYNNNQQQDALKDAFNSVKQYSDKSLGVLKGVYDQGVAATQPYQQAGTNALGGYQNLLQNPNSITSDPGYQFRFDQGAEALRRNLAATGMRGSGNEMMALTDYGQNTATSELDKSLGRYLPLMTAGQNATGQQMDAGRSYSYGVAGVNQGLADAAAGMRLGQSGATTGLLNSLLAQGGGTQATQQNPLQQAAGAAGTLANAGNTLNSGYNTLQTLLNGGAAAGSAVPGMVGALNGLGQAGTGLAGMVGAPVSAPFVGAGSSVPGMVSTMDALANGAGFDTVLSNSALGQAAGIQGGQTAAQTGLNSGDALSGSFNPFQPGIANLAAPLAMVGALKWLASTKGGSVESAKTGKLGSQLQADMQADPTGAKAQATMDKLINNQLWPGEGNQWVISDLLTSGALKVDYPGLHSSTSVYDAWSNPSPSLDKFDWKNEAYAKAAGMNEQEQAEFTSLNQRLVTAQRAAETAASEGGVSAARMAAKVAAPKAAYDAFIAKMEPRRQQNAQTIYTNLRNSGYSGDLSKLETYLGVR